MSRMNKFSTLIRKSKQVNVLCDSFSIKLNVNQDQRNPLELV